MSDTVHTIWNNCGTFFSKAIYHFINEVIILQFINHFSTV